MVKNFFIENLKNLTKESLIPAVVHLTDSNNVTADSGLQDGFYYQPLHFTRIIT